MQGGMGAPFGPQGGWPPVPRLWRRKTCVIAGAGPSLEENQLEEVRESQARLIVVNTTYRLAPWADVLYGCDWGWWNKYSEGVDSWRGFEGLKVSQDPHTPKAFTEVKRVPSVNEPGISLDPMRIHQGANSGFQALNLAILMGAARIILLGFDMRDYGSPHWHGSHPSGLNNPKQHNYDQWVGAFTDAVPDIERAGVEVVNCTPGSALTCFPMRKLGDLL